MIDLSPVILFLQSWDIFFRNANSGAPPGAAYQSPPPLNGTPQGLASFQTLVGAQPNVEKLVEDHLAVQSLIRAYQVNHKHTWAVTWKLFAATLVKGFIFILSAHYVPDSDIDCVSWWRLSRQDKTSYTNDKREQTDNSQ